MPILGVFFVYFVFSNKQILQQIPIWEKCPSSIRCRDSNPQPSEHESPPITTRPGIHWTWNSFITQSQVARRLLRWGRCQCATKINEKIQFLRQGWRWRSWKKRFLLNLLKDKIDKKRPIKLEVGFTVLELFTREELNFYYECNDFNGNLLF